MSYDKKGIGRIEFYCKECNDFVNCFDIEFPDDSGFSKFGNKHSKFDYAIYECSSCGAILGKILIILKGKA